MFKAKQERAVLVPGIGWPEKLRKAAEYGILPREMQSILWEQQRRLWVDKKLKDGVAADIYKTLREMGVIDEEQLESYHKNIRGGRRIASEARI